MQSGDCAFVDAAFTNGPMACKRPGAVGPEHIAHFKQGLRQPYGCGAALDYYRAAVDSATRFPSLAGTLLNRWKFLHASLDHLAGSVIAVSPSPLCWYVNWQFALQGS